MITNKYLFNFSASYLGGGFKRISEYVRYFNEKGGAHFILHSNCKILKEQFPNNSYFFVKQGILDRVFNDVGYLQDIVNKIDGLELYYSYSIPIYFKIAKVNWFHLSNALPLVPFKYPVGIINHFKMLLLGVRIKSKFINADVISAESHYSLQLLSSRHAAKFFRSVNGSDDEINMFTKISVDTKSNIAVILGTYKYKDLYNSYKIFLYLRNQNSNLKLKIVGDKKYIPKYILLDENVEAIGLLSRKEVISLLLSAKYFITTSKIENSYNAASEGIFFADESYISDIGPHKELLKNEKFNLINLNNIESKIIQVKRNDLTLVNIKSWDTVIEEMIEKTKQYL